MSFSFAAEASDPQTACDIRSLIQKHRPATTTTTAHARSDAEMLQILHRVRESLINDIRGGKAFAELSAAQQLMIRRLESIDRLVFKDCPNQRSTNPGASYKLLANSIEVCQQTKTAPEIALVAVFGHELGHSIDLVNLGCRTLRVTARGISIPAVRPTPSTQASSQTSSEISSEITMTNSRDFYSRPLDAEAWADNLEKIRDSNGRTFNDCALKTKAEKDAMDTLIRSGRVEVVDSGVSVLSHPQRAAFACLRNHWQGPELPTTQEQAEYGGYFKYGEKSAQMWGARAVARYAESKPNLSAQEALGITQFTPIYDSKVHEKEIDLNSVYFAEPALQRVFHCQPSAKQNCMSRFTPGRVQSDAHPATTLPATNPKSGTR